MKAAILPSPPTIATSLGEVVTSTLGPSNLDLVFPGASIRPASFLRLV